MLIIPQTIMPCKHTSKKTPAAPAAPAEPAEPAEPDDSVSASPPPDKLPPATKLKCKNWEYNPTDGEDIPKKKVLFLTWSLSLSHQVKPKNDPLAQSPLPKHHG